MADEVSWLVEIVSQAKAEQDWLLKSSVKSCNKTVPTDL